MAPVSNFMEGKVFVNHLGIGGGGFSESYKLNTTSYATGKAQLLEIILNREKLLPYDWQVVHATVSLKRTKNDSAVPVGYSGDPVLLDAEADLATEALCNDREAALLFRFDTGAGKTASRFLRAIRDSWIEANTLLVGFNDLAPLAPHVATVATDSATDALINYFNTTGIYTFFFDEVGVNSWEPIPWENIQYQRVSDRDMGVGYSSRKNRRKRAI